MQFVFAPCSTAGGVARREASSDEAWRLGWEWHCFRFPPSPLKKKTLQKFINFRRTIQIYRFVLCSAGRGSVPRVDPGFTPLHVNTDQTSSSAQTAALLCILGFNDRVSSRIKPTTATNIAPSETDLCVSLGGL